MMGQGNEATKIVDYSRRVVAVDHRVTDDDLAWMDRQLAPVGAVARRTRPAVDTSWVTFERVR